MSKTNFSREEIENFINEKYKTNILLTPVKEGMESQVYSFNFNNKEYILRINKTDYGFRKDEYAYNNFNSKDIPIPVVNVFDKFGDSAYYCISEKVEGITYEDSDHETIVKLAPLVYKLLIDISEIDVAKFKGFGKIDYNTGNGEFDTFSEYLVDILNKEEWNKVINFCESLNIDLLDISEIFKSLIKYVPETRKLVHGDFANNNLIVNKEKNGFSGVIDWDCCEYGDPLQSVAAANFWSKHLDCATEMAKYYNEKLKDTPNYFEIMQFYQLRIVLEEIYENALEEDEKEVKWCYQRALEILNGDVLVRNDEIFTKSTL